MNIVLRAALWTSLGAVAIVLLASLALPAPAQQSVDAAIVFVIDRSHSMGVGNERRLVNLGHISAIQSKEVLGAIEDGIHGRIAVSVVEFANDAHVKVGWTIIDGIDSAKSFAAAFLGRGPGLSETGSTSITDGMIAAYELLLTLPYKADKLVVDVTGDGGHNYMASPPPNGARDAILALGGVVNGLPIVVKPGKIPPVDYYAEYVVGGPASFNLPVKGFDEYPMKIRQKLVWELF